MTFGIRDSQTGFLHISNNSVNNADLARLTSVEMLSSGDFNEYEPTCGITQRFRLRGILRRFRDEPERLVSDRSADPFRSVRADGSAPAADLPSNHT